MFTTTESLKQNAKDVLSRSYWMAFVACLIVTIISGTATSLVSRISTTMVQGASAPNYIEYMQEGDFESLVEINNDPQVVLASSVSRIINSLVEVFLINVLTVGLISFFISNSRGTTDIGKIFGVFTGNYLNTVLITFLESLFIGLWSLLFIVPGIIKAYSYFMVKYIVADNPDIDYKRAFEISKKTMDGQKFFCFCLQLSFIGWYLLGVLACCVGVIFVTPYYNQTMAEFYEFLKQKALSAGIATSDDFGIPSYYSVTDNTPVFDDGADNN